MTKDIRLQHKRRASYRTRSNKVRPVKTPGGRLVTAYIKKRGTVPKCGDCKQPMQGLKAVRPYNLKKLHQRQRHVSRAYGGSRCATCVRERIVRAFLIEEQQIVKRVVAQRQTKTKKK